MLDFLSSVSSHKFGRYSNLTVHLYEILEGMERKKVNFQVLVPSYSTTREILSSVTLKITDVKLLIQPINSYLALERTFYSVHVVLHVTSMETFW